MKPGSAGAAPGMVVSLIQPPLVQLNAPYPAVYYLKSFLEDRGYRTRTRDHSIGLFERIFCKRGLQRIFADARKAYRDSGRSPGPGRGNGRGAEKTLYHIERFLSEEDRWLSSIDRLIAFLRGRDREFGHLLTLTNGVLPGGPRYDAHLASAGMGESDPDSAAILAGKLLADMADFISRTLDPSFALIRYAESPASGLRDFSRVAADRNGYILRTFYRPFLEAEWQETEGFIRNAGQNSITDENSNGAKNSSAVRSSIAAVDVPGEGLLLGVTIPFAGCLAGALACAESAKQYFGGRVVTVAGGGYVNTDLRFIQSRKFFDFFDYLSFDRGYGSLEAILEHLEEGRTPRDPEDPVLYKTLYRSGRNGRIVGSTGTALPGERAKDGEKTAGNTGLSRGFKTDRRATGTVFPDYGGVDFSQYLYAADDSNPMFRLWTDGHWLKAYLAHGCYWHNCAFCDVGLDYIRSFRPVPPEALFRHLLDQAEKTGVRGVHLVDEAAPVPSLIHFAELNREAGLPLIFWGNIRFEENFSPDTAALLAAGGLVGVSGGIEIATEAGFKRIGKGIGLREAVRSCAAFKEQGILTHGYLIYGYWDETVQEIIDSAEILRQIFAEGLLDSAFWHKFVLTRHSRIYAEWKRGLHEGLTITDLIPEPKDTAILTEGAAAGGPLGAAFGTPGELFGYNDLRFAGEDGFDRFGEPLDRLLASWMEKSKAGLRSPVEQAFPFAVPAPTVSPRTVPMLLDAYARDRDRDRAAVPEQGMDEGRKPGGKGGEGAAPGRLLFLGSEPLIKTREGRAYLWWRWRLGEHRLRIGRPGDAAERTVSLLSGISRQPGMTEGTFFTELTNILGRENAPEAWRILRNGGLIRYR
ncbi:MAG: radical SAM protein [Spirochaetaceae bacterium]|nr:radical SAM protein [Spirochaetaceae bacterium]